MTTNDPLTHRFKHEAREIDPDPRDWFEAPERPPPVAWTIVLVLAILVVFSVAFWWVRQ
jgi:hypothetical protein